MDDATCPKDGCGKPLHAMGLCGTHYMQVHRAAKAAGTNKQCGKPGCSNNRTIRRWCDEHYAERRLAHFRADVDKNGPLPVSRPDLGRCWIWTGRVNHNGYGLFSARKSDLAHRFAYETAIGVIPARLQLDHLCHPGDGSCRPESCLHRRCVNPAHLEPVTQRENLHRSGVPAFRAFRTGICEQGHTLTPGKQCAICEKAREDAQRLDPTHPRHRLNRRPDAKYRVMSQAEIAEVERLAAEGLSGLQISKRLGRSSTAVYRVLSGRRKRPGALD